MQMQVGGRWYYVPPKMVRAIARTYQVPREIEVTVRFDVTTENGVDKIIDLSAPMKYATEEYKLYLGTYHYIARALLVSGSLFLPK